MVCAHTDEHRCLPSSSYTLPPQILLHVGSGANSLETLFGLLDNQQSWAKLLQAPSLLLPISLYPHCIGLPPFLSLCGLPSLPRVTDISVSCPVTWCTSSSCHAPPSVHGSQTTEEGVGTKEAPWAGSRCHKAVRTPLALYRMGGGTLGIFNLKGSAGGLFAAAYCLSQSRYNSQMLCEQSPASSDPFVRSI